MKMPRITLRRLALFTALVLVANSFVLWSTAQRRWAERRVAFEQKLNVSDPRMLYIYSDLKNQVTVSLDSATPGLDKLLTNSTSVILRVLQCDGAAISALPADKASTPMHDPRTPECFIDESRTYKFLSFALEASKEWSTEQRVEKKAAVCLSSQLSVDGLFWVSEQMKTWNGRFSLAVFTPDVDYTIAMLMIRAMEVCDERTEQSVDFHFVYPVDMPPVLEEFEDISYNCSTLEQYNQQLVDTFRTSSFKRTIQRTKYPQNLLRNIARDRCLSEYSFTPDIDMIATPKMYEKLENFLLSRAYDNCDKCAYIIPTYEIAIGKRYPEDKNELLTYIDKKKAQRFHIHVYSPNQANSNLSRWEVTQKTSDVSILYNITTYGEYWEPIYVAKTSELPQFRERFVGYGFTRNSQVLEMVAAGYSWFMLDTPFLSHRGFQSTKGRSRYRKSQISANSRIYTKFKLETFQRYNISPNDPRFRRKPNNSRKKKPL